VVFFGLTVFMGLGNGICLPNANAGMLSVRPELAGTASGLGGAILIGGGAALAALAGALLAPAHRNAADPPDARLLGRLGHRDPLRHPPRPQIGA
jgi:MFS family permease